MYKQFAKMVLGNWTQEKGEGENYMTKCGYLGVTKKTTKIKRAVNV